MRARFSLSKVTYSLLAALLVSAPAIVGAQSPYTYGGSITTDMSAITCRPVNATQESTVVFREIFSGLATSSSSPAGGLPFTCPLVRRNTTIYNNSIPLGAPTRLDRVQMTFLQINVNDGANDGTLSCSASVYTSTGGFFVSSTRYACGSPGGCTSPPANSVRVATELTWTNPFGTVPIQSKGAASVGYTCVVPRASNLLWARAAFSPN